MNGDGGAAPPQNRDAEESVLGGCMLGGKAVDACQEHVTPADFYFGSHGKVFAAIIRLHAADSPVDAVTLADELARSGELEAIGGRARINELAVNVPAASNVAHYAQIVAEHARMRAVITAGQEIIELARERQGTAEEVLDRAEQAIFRATQTREQAEFATAAEVVTEEYDRVIERGQRATNVIGVPTGFQWLDRVTTGLLPGNLIVLAGRPSMGKSGLALGIAAHATLRAQIPTALFTLEMSRVEVVQRMLSAEALIESTKLRTGRLGVDEWGRLAKASGAIAQAPLYIDDQGAATAVEVRSKSRRLKTRVPDLGLVVIDYLQLMGSGADRFESRVQEVSQISRSLKLLARDLNIPVLAVSQLSRSPEHRHDKRPILSDLRDSGSIEQDADIVCFVYRDDYYHPDDTEDKGVAELSIAKHRNGPTTVIKLGFTEDYAKFMDLAWNART